jgi:hypothetical protein
MWNVLVIFCGATLLAFAQEPAPAAQGGCESREIRSGKEKGKQERFFAAPVAKVKEEILNALAALEFEVKKDKGSTVEARKRRHIGVFVGSGGEKMVIQLVEAEQDGKQGTRVIAETKKGFVGRVGQKSWAGAVLDQAECLLQVRPS